MYTGTLIEELVNTVEWAEKRAIENRVQNDDAAFWYAVSQSQLSQLDSNLAGVA